jgi:hypothetical protein
MSEAVEIEKIKSRTTIVVSLIKLVGTVILGLCILYSPQFINLKEIITFGGQ